MRESQNFWHGIQFFFRDAILALFFSLLGYSKHSLGYFSLSKKFFALRHRIVLICRQRVISFTATFLVFGGRLDFLRPDLDVFGPTLLNSCHTSGILHAYVMVSISMPLMVQTPKGLI